MIGSEAGRRPVVLLDACVLIPIRLTSALLWMAEADLIEVLWSDEILDEVRRNLPRVGVSDERAAWRVATMRRAFGSAAMVEDYQHLMPHLRCDAKDRHVLAAAIRGGADVLVTFNLKDFPQQSTEHWRIEVLDPDALLLGLLVDRRDDVLAALGRGVAALRRPPQTLHRFLSGLASTTPVFAKQAIAELHDSRT